LRRLIPALVFVLATASSCSILTTARYHEIRYIGHGTRVLLIGDSNAAYAGPALDRVLGARDTASIDAQPGIKADDPRWEPRVHADVAMTRPQVVVVQLGTNDASPSDAGAFPGALDRIMRALPAGIPVLWANVRTVRGVGQEWVDAARAVNLALDRATARWPNLHVIDYARHFAGHPEWVPPDGVHLTVAGHTEYARWIRGEVSRFVDRRR
jgi:lysophospholipase L1-like esterase